MKNAVVQLGLVLLGISSVHAVKLLQSASFHLRVYPSGGVEKIWAIREKDSIPMSGSDGEYFLTTFPPGKWQVWIDAKRPYQDAIKTANLQAGTNIDLGTIRLEQ